MAVSVRRVTVVDRFHYNGDPDWDGDQTLYEVGLADEDESLLVVVPRGDAFIPERVVGRYVERLGVELLELLARATAPGTGDARRSRCRSSLGLTSASG